VPACYLELADKVREGLGKIDPYFIKLSEAMLAWVACWQALNPEEETKA
jgi:reversibly glycosylated polypeptide/UDP-arabinopyranose mutase